MKKQMLSAMALACLMTTQTLPAYGAAMEAMPAMKESIPQTAAPAKEDLTTAIEKPRRRWPLTARSGTFSRMTAMTAAMDCAGRSIGGSREIPSRSCQQRSMKTG